MMRPFAGFLDRGATSVEIHGEIDRPIGCRRIVWQLESKPDSEGGGKHARAF
jgi:hypothetical protein